MTKLKIEKLSVADGRVDAVRRQLNALPVDKVVEALTPRMPSAELFGKRSAKRMHSQDMARLVDIRDGLTELLDGQVSTEQMLADINEHRRAVGRAPIKKETSIRTLEKHLALINEHAPYGNDPWEK